MSDQTRADIRDQIRGALDFLVATARGHDYADETRILDAEMLLEDALGLLGDQPDRLGLPGQPGPAGHNPRSAYVNPDSNKAHRMGSWWQADDGTITPSGTGCGALLRGYRQVPLTETTVADRCKVCWPAWLRTSPVHEQIHQPETGASTCACGDWEGPMTTLLDNDPRSYAAHLAANGLLL